MLRRLNNAYTLLALIVIVGVIVRLWAITYGLPSVYHMEEPFYSQAAENLACDTNLDSSLLQLHTYLFAASIKTGSIFDQQYCTEGPRTTSAVLLLGRLISVILGTLTIFMVYKLGTILFSVPAGLLGALFIALNFLHVRESQHGTPDVATVFLIICTLISYVRLSKPNPPLWRFFLAGILTVLSINGRLTNVVLLLPLVCAYLSGQNLSWRKNYRDWLRAILDRRVILTMFVMLFTFLIVNPQIWVDPIAYLQYWKSFFTLSRFGGFGLYIVDPLPAPLYYLRSIEWGGGLLLGLVSIVGVLWAIRRHTLGDILLLGFIVPYFIIASSSKVYFARYIIPITPLLGILVARFMWEVLQTAPRRALVWGIAAVILLIEPVNSILHYAYLQSQEDTRTIAQDWISANIPQGAKIATEWHSPTIDANVYHLTIVDFYGLSVEPFEQYQQEGFQYLVSSSFIQDNTFISEEDEARKKDFYAKLTTNGQLVAEFKPYSGDVAPAYNIDQVLGPITSLDQFNRPGPTIKIYKIKS